MNARRLAVAALVVAALVASAWWLRFEKPRREAARAEAEASLLEPGEELTALTVLRGDERHELARAADGSWQLSSSELPEPVRADARALALVSRALTQARLVTLERRAEDAGALSAFGLEPRRLEIEWTSAAGTRRLRLGDPVPPDGSRTYALYQGRLVTAERELTVNTAWGSAHWRNKILLEFGPEDLRRLELLRAPVAGPGRSAQVVLGRDEDERGQSDGWRVLEPFDAPAHHLRVPSLLGWLMRLEADGFGPERPTAEDLREAGLEPPTAIARLEMTDGTVHEIAFGRPRDLRPDEEEQAGDREVMTPVNARLDGGGLVQLRPDLAEAVVALDDELRDNRALPLHLSLLVGLRFTKPRREGEPRVLELARGADGSWNVSRPAPAPLAPSDATALLAALQQVQFGRFEDALARDPAGFEAAYDLTGPDTFTVEAQALDAEGRPLSVLLEAAPPGEVFHDRTPYRPVRLTDQAGRRTVAIAKFKAFDKFLDQAVALHDSLAEGGGAGEP